MNLKTWQLVLGIVALLAIGFGLGVYGSGQSATYGGSRGQVMYSDLSIGGDLYQFGYQIAEALLAHNGVLVGNVSSSNVTGTVVSAGSLVINGGTAINASAQTSTWYPQAAITLGSYTVATSTTSTLVAFPFGTANGFAVGDSCAVGFNQAPSSTSFGEDGTLTLVGTTTATATVTLWNGANASLTLQTTSTYAGGASSTLIVRCNH